VDVGDRVKWRVQDTGGRARIAGTKAREKNKNKKKKKENCRSSSILPVMYYVPVLSARYLSKGERELSGVVFEELRTVRKAQQEDSVKQTHSARSILIRIFVGVFGFKFLVLVRKRRTTKRVANKTAREKKRRERDQLTRVNAGSDDETERMVLARRASGRIARRPSCFSRVAPVRFIKSSLGPETVSGGHVENTRRRPGVRLRTFFERFNYYLTRESFYGRR